MWTPWLVALFLSLLILLFEQAGGDRFLQTLAYRASQPSLETTRAIRIVIQKVEYQVVFWREGARRLSQLERDRVSLQIDRQRLHDLQQENESLRKALSLSESQTRVARWYGSVNQWFVDRGCNQGVQSGEAVLMDGSLVGVIKTPYPEYSTVSTWTDATWRMPVKIGTESARGVFTSQEGYLAVTEVPAQVGIKEGDQVSTSGNGLLNPDLPIGTVQSILLIPGMGTQEVTLKPYFQTRDVSWVRIQQKSEENTCS